MKLTERKELAMENVLHNNHPPPYWDLTLELNENGNPLYLSKAWRIITSYLEPRQIQHSRIVKGTHLFHLHSVGEPIDRSIYNTIENETWPHLKVTKGEYHDVVT